MRARVPRAAGRRRSRARAAGRDCSSRPGWSPATRRPSSWPTRRSPGPGRGCGPGWTTTSRASGSCGTSAVAADAWDALGRPDSELYRGARLHRALDWQGPPGADLTDTERDFLDRAGQVADQEAAIQEREARYWRRTVRRLTGLVAVAACLTLVAGVAGTVALRQRDEAASERQQAAAERLVASARRAATLSQATDDIEPGSAAGRRGGTAATTRPTPGPACWPRSGACGPSTGNRSACRCRRWPRR